MKTRRTVRLLPLFLLACVSTPDAADVAADRSRWTAVRDVTADGTISAGESPVLAELLSTWDAKLTADETATGSARGAKTILADLLRVYGEAAVAVAVADPAVQAAAQKTPELFRLIDRDSNGSLSVDELLAIDPASPVFSAVVVTTAARLLRR